jgi:hypothetical protein
MDRELTGFFIRTNEGATKDITDATKEEIQEYLKTKEEKWKDGMIILFCQIIRKIGDDLDLKMGNP